jgi:tetratricopeptide (TPR) repeat protein
MTGAAVGPYRVLEKLGSGGMGEVFLGHDPRLDRRVALKCLTSVQPASPEGHARILREARAVARLTHPNIAGVYDVLEEGDRTFIVMEYVEGINLAAHLAGGPRPAGEVRAVGRQLASALAAAHAQGVVHRDLKPANIQVMRDGSIKVLDFGVAKLSAVSATRTETTTSPPAEATVEGNPGTVLYMAPEQLLSRPIDARSDIYSAGVVLFLMATGRRPYLESTAATLAVAMNANAAPSARSINPLVPQELSDAIARALERDPDKRFQSAQEFGAALEPLGEGTTQVVRRPRLAPNRRRRALAAAAAILILFGAVLWRPLSTRIGLRLATPQPLHEVIAVLPVDNPTGDPQTSYLGDVLASLVSSNFRAVPGITVLSRAATIGYGGQRLDLQRLQNTLGAHFVLHLTVASASPTDLTVWLARPDAPELDWQQRLTGNPVDIGRALLEGVARSVSRRSGRAFTDTEWAAIRRLPTSRGDAVLAYTEARALLERNDLAANVERAINRLQDAVTSDPSFALTHAMLGVSLLMRWEKTRDPALIDRATPEVMTALRLDSASSAPYYAQGMLQYITGRRDAAVESLRRAIELDPDSDDAHRLLGWRLLSTQGRTDEAVAELREAVRIRPNSFENHYRLGTVLYLAGRYPQAVDAYRTATELQPTRADAFTNLGAAYHMLGDVEQAIGNYQHAISLGAGDALAYSNLAYSYFLASRYSQALEASLEAMKRDPMRASTHADAGEYYKRLGKTREARAAYQRAIELARRSLTVDPRDAAAVGLIAVCEANLGHAVDADLRAAEALALAPTDRNVLLRSAKVYTLLGNRTRAFDSLRGAIEHGLSPQLVRDDPELTPIRSAPQFEAAIAAGLSARERAGAVK